jgi:hypothetical protein
MSATTAPTETTARPPAPARDRRRSLSAGVIQVALVAMALSALGKAVGDPVEVIRKVRGASLGWVALAVVLWALTNVSDAIATRGAVAHAFPWAAPSSSRSRPPSLGSPRREALVRWR